MGKWEIAPVPDVTFFQEGPGVRNTQYTTTGVKLINVANLQNGKVDLSTSDRYISEDEAYGKYKHFLVDDGDFIIASSGIQVDYFEKKMGFVDSSQLPLCMNTSTIRFKSVDENRLYIIYFMYCLKTPQFKEQLKRLITGSAQLNFGPSHLKKMTIPLPPLDVQRRIADVLDRASALIEKRKVQIDKLDLLVKSQFIEMFGIPGAKIKGWGFKKLGECCELNPKKGQDKRLGIGLQVSFVPMPAVSENGVIDPSQIRNYNEVKTGFTYFADNDVLFAKITPCMENGKGAIAKGLYNGIGFGSTEFHVLRPLQGKSNPYWLYTATSFEQFRLDAAANMTGSAGQRRVPVAFLDSFKISLPPIELQDEFADFALQVETQKSLLQQSLAKLELNYKSLMQKCFRGEIF